ncbi:hypothetical protein HZC07_00845 [Candidatus Micrarchaeota archaeon]|nr:hypothetical protein [Candidatus Micrarchaeota archaeon]
MIRSFVRLQLIFFTKNNQPRVIFVPLFGKKKPEPPIQDPVLHESSHFTSTTPLSRLSSVFRSFKKPFAMLALAAELISGNNINNVGGNPAMAYRSESSQVFDEAKKAAETLRDFVLSGDNSKKAEFLKLIGKASQSSTANAFIDLFKKELKVFYEDSKSPVLKLLINSYLNLESDPTKRVLDFVSFVNSLGEIYGAATTGDQKKLTPRNSFINAVLEQHAKIAANNALELLKKAVASSDPGVETQLLAMLSGRANPALMQDHNPVNSIPGAKPEGQTYLEIFKTTFLAALNSEMKTNRSLADARSIFKKVSLSAVFRDIYLELGKQAPNYDRIGHPYYTSAGIYGREGRDATEAMQAQRSSMRWMVKDQATIETELQRRAPYDPVASALSKPVMKASRAAGIAECYAELTDLNVQGNLLISRANILRDSVLKSTPDDIFEKRGKVYDLLFENPGQLDWLGKEIDKVSKSKDPAKSLRAEIEKRAKAPRENAFPKLLLTHDSADLIAVYAEISANRAEFDSVKTAIDSFPKKQVDVTQALGTKYGPGFVDIVAKNLEPLSWVVKPAGAELDQEIRSHTELSGVVDSLGKTGEKLAPFVYALSEAKRGAANPAELQSATAAVGEELVARVRGNRGPVAAYDMGLSVESTRAVIQSRAKDIKERFVGLRKQLDYPELAPVKSLLLQQVEDWERKNDSIAAQAERVVSSQELSALSFRQVMLEGEVLKDQDLKLSVRMAFAFIHLVETGGDYLRFSDLTAGAPFADPNGEMAQLLKWYNNLNGKKSFWKVQLQKSVMCLLILQSI